MRQPIAAFDRLIAKCAIKLPHVLTLGVSKCRQHETAVPTKNLAKRRCALREPAAHVDAEFAPPRKGLEQPDTERHQPTFIVSGVPASSHGLRVVFHSPLTMFEPAGFGMVVPYFPNSDLSDAYAAIFAPRESTVETALTRLVPGAGLGPARRSYPARDFKSLVSTSFTTRAGGYSWRRGSESNRRTRLCRPLHNHSATPPGPATKTKKGKRNFDSGLIYARVKMHFVDSGAAAGYARVEMHFAFPESGAGKESRTPDLNLGKVALYQLSYSRVT